jgi:hypothetical protein
VNINAISAFARNFVPTFERVQYRNNLCRFRREEGKGKDANKNAQFES